MSTATTANPASIAPGAGLNWNATSKDYAAFRPTYPPSYFSLLQQLGIGRKGQNILDLGAGTGALALPFARQGASVVALDASVGQLEQLELKASQEGIGIRTLHRRAEETGLPADNFDAITASMCWGYFDRNEILPEVDRLLKPKGLLLVSALIWDHDDPVSRVTDSLVARYNPASVRRAHDDRFDPVPGWLQDPFRLRGYLAWNEPISFTAEAWRGRIRASKWIGAALHPDIVTQFDQEHALALAPFGERFEVSHRITLHIAERTR